MADLENPVNPLFWDVPIVNDNGTPTQEFMRKWEQQAATNASIPNLTTAAAVSEILDLIGSTIGDLLVRGTFTWGVLPPNTAGFVLTDGGPGAQPNWQALPAQKAPASALDDGTNFYLAMQDATGQLVLDSFNDPIFVPEVLPTNALPIATSSAVGAVKVDNKSIAVAGDGTISTLANCLAVKLSVNQSIADSTYTKVSLDSVIVDTQSAFNVSTHLWTPAAGKYLICANSQGLVVTSITVCALRISKNGLYGSGGTSVGASLQGALSGSVTNSNVLNIATIITMNGSDTLELDAYIAGTGGGNAVNSNGGDGTTQLNAIYLGP